MATINWEKTLRIGERIKNRRAELGLSADEVAAVLGKNRATIYRYESHDIEKLPITALEPLADVLRTTPAYLMGWTDDPTIPEDTEENLNAPTDIIDALDGDAERITEFMRAVDNDRAMEAGMHPKAAKLLDLFSKLNNLGQDRVLEFVEDLTQVEKYTQ